MAFVRCLTPDVVAQLAKDEQFAPSEWEVLRVANTDDADVRTISADAAVERRETKGPAVLLLVDTDRAGAGMDGIYSAAREVHETTLFEEALRLAGAAVTSRSSGSRRRYAEQAIRKAAGFGGQYSVPPWTRFDFLCRIAARDRDPGAYVHLLGLWPIAGTSEGDEGELLDMSRRFVDHFLGPAAASLTSSARIESLRLAELTGEQRRDLDRFLHAAEAQPLLPALERLASKEHLWVGGVRLERAKAIQSVELVPWRNKNGKVAKWSGLLEETENEPPALILKTEAAESGDYSKLEVKWKAQPGNLERNAVDYRVVVSTDLDEELAAREVRHSGRKEEKCRFGDDDFSSLEEDSVVSAKVMVFVVGNEAIKSDPSEEFIIRFGEPPVSGALGAGRIVRTFSEGLIELGERERLADLTGSAAGAKGFVSLRTPSGQRRKSYRVVRPDLINEVETQWIGRTGAVDRWRVTIRASGERAGNPEFIPLQSAGGPAFDRAALASRRMAERFCVGGDGGGGGVGQVYDDQSKAFDAAKEYVLAWTALLDSSDPSAALCNTVEVQSLAGRTLGLIVLPAHPLRVAWHAAYDNLVFHAAFDQERSAKAVESEFKKGLDGAMFPAFLPNPAGGTFVFADTLGFHAVGMVPDSDREPKAAVALLARALGAGDAADAAATVGGQSASVLGNEILKYLDCHDTSRLLHVHALRAGDGLTIARALGRVHKHHDDEDETDVAGRSESEADSSPTPAPVFSLDLYPSERQRGVAGQFIAAARERRRSGAGVVSQDDRWMLESVSLPGGVNVPRLRWARKRIENPETAAHLAVAFDTFESRVVAEARESPGTRPFHAFGLLSFYERGYSSAPSPVWRSTIPLAKDGEKHPSERGHTERLVRVDRAIRSAVARHLDGGRGLPVLRTDVSPDREASLRDLHGLCDWVITLDRNAGVEYFDSPRDSKEIYDAYVIDCVPEREDLGCLQLITSTSNLDEVRGMLDEALDQMGLSRSRRNAAFLLEQLKALSGRIAIRLTGNRPPTAELIALALAHANCRTAPSGQECWPSLEDGFLIPVDDVQDLLPCLEADDSDRRRAGKTHGDQERARSTPSGESVTRPGARPDLIHVSTLPRKGLVFRFVEVKYRRDLLSARRPDVLRQIQTQTTSLRRRWHEWFDAGVSSSFRAVRRARLARVLRFYADKARRHHLSAERYEAFVAEIDRMIEKGSDYAFSHASAGDRGWVFCPEHAGREPQRISPDGWSVPTFLFGPGRLPDADVGREMIRDPVERLRDDERDGAPSDGGAAKGAASIVGEGPVGAAGGALRNVVTTLFGRGASHATTDPTAGTGATGGTTSAVATPRGSDAAREAPAAPGATSVTADETPSLDLGTDAHSGAGVRWSLTVRGNPHLLVAGLPGMGKTTCLLGLCQQMVDAGIHPIVFSYHQDIDERLADLVDSVRFVDCDGLGFNPLAVTDRESPRAYLDVAGSLRDIFAAIFPDLGDLQCESIRRAIKESFVEAGWSASGAGAREPEFIRFVEILRSDPKPDRGLRTLLARLTELEDYGFFQIGESRESLWTSDRPVVVRIHTTQNESLQRAFASLVFYGLYKEMFRRGIQERITHALIFDEAHRAAGLKLIPTMAKECRKYGISLVVASQEAKDFNESLFSAIANYLVLRLTEADAKALVRNVATARQERALIDRIKQMARFRALYFCEGRRQPALVGLRSLD